MNFALILTTIFTSAADSLNPVAITQQFVLQGMVKKRSHIWFFILATYITNFICGMMVYYGLLEILSSFWGGISNTLGGYLYALELAVGIGMLCFCIFKFIRYTVNKRQVKNSVNDADEEAVRSKIKSVSPVSLYFLGTIATIMELTSAFPYFAFLGVLLNYRLSFFEVTILQIIYNIIYASPLMLLYFIYCKKQTLFDRVYSWVKKKMQKIGIFITPILFAVFGILLTVHALNLLFNNAVTL